MCKREGGIESVCVCMRERGRERYCVCVCIRNDAIHSDLPNDKKIDTDSWAGLY